MSEHRFLTVEEVADALSMESRTITKWLRAGTLRGYKFGNQWRVKRTDLDEFIEKRAGDAGDTEEGEEEDE